MLFLLYRGLKLRKRFMLLRQHLYVKALLQRFSFGVVVSCKYAFYAVLCALNWKLNSQNFQNLQYSLHQELGLLLVNLTIKIALLQIMIFNRRYDILNLPKDTYHSLSFNCVYILLCKILTILLILQQLISYYEGLVLSLFDWLYDFLFWVFEYVLEVHLLDLLIYWVV